MTYNSVPTTIYRAVGEKSKFKMLNSDNSWHGNNWVVWKVGYSEFISLILKKKAGHDTMKVSRENRTVLMTVHQLSYLSTKIFISGQIKKQS